MSLVGELDEGMGVTYNRLWGVWRDRYGAWIETSVVRSLERAVTEGHLRYNPRSQRYFARRSRIRAAGSSGGGGGRSHGGDGVAIDVVVGQRDRLRHRIHIVVADGESSVTAPVAETQAVATQAMASTSGGPTGHGDVRRRSRIPRRIVSPEELQARRLLDRLVAQSPAHGPPRRQRFDQTLVFRAATWPKADSDDSNC